MIGPALILVFVWVSYKQRKNIKQFIIVFIQMNYLQWIGFHEFILSNLDITDRQMHLPINLFFFFSRKCINFFFLSEMAVLCPCVCTSYSPGILKLVSSNMCSLNIVLDISMSCFIYLIYHITSSLLCILSWYTKLFNIITSNRSFCD